MAKVNAEYYNLEKAAEVLSVSTAEVNRLREQNKLRGFRDGSNWKFLKDNIHTYLAESIKARNGNSGGSLDPGESGFDLLESDASASSFDILVENAELLPDEDELVSVNSSSSSKALASDLDLGALENDDDDLSLAEETRVSSVAAVRPPKSAAPATPPQEDLAAQDDSDLVLASSGVSESDSDVVLLDDNDSILGGSGSSPQLGLAGNSGFDILLDGEENEELFEVEVDDEKADVNLAQEEDFVLEPAAAESDDAESDSSSQVIAIETGFASAEGEADPFGGGFDPSDFGGGFSFDTQQQADSSETGPFGGSAFPSSFPSPTPSSAAKKTASVEEEYSTGILISLVSVLVLLLLPAWMLVDAMSFMWSWDEKAYVLTSPLMDAIAGTLGLK